jgi:hypothetical protein
VLLARWAYVTEMRKRPFFGGLIRTENLGRNAPLRV